MPGNFSLVRLFESVERNILKVTFDFEMASNDKTSSYVIIKVLVSMIKFLEYIFPLSFRVGSQK
jgi:hypothetical protein